MSQPFLRPIIAVRFTVQVSGHSVIWMGVLKVLQLLVQDVTKRSLVRITLSVTLSQQLSAAKMKFKTSYNSP